MDLSLYGIVYGRYAVAGLGPSGVNLYDNDIVLDTAKERICSFDEDFFHPNVFLLEKNIRYLFFRAPNLDLLGQKEIRKDDVIDFMELPLSAKECEYLMHAENLF